MNFPTAVDNRLENMLYTNKFRGICNMNFTRCIHTCSDMYALCWEQNESKGQNLLRTLVLILTFIFNPAHTFVIIFVSMREDYFEF